MWMNYKAAANQDYGRDEDAAVKILKKHKVKGGFNCKLTSSRYTFFNFAWLD